MFSVDRTTKIERKIAPRIEVQHSFLCNFPVNDPDPDTEKNKIANSFLIIWSLKLEEKAIFKKKLYIICRFDVIE